MGKDDTFHRLGHGFLRGPSRSGCDLEGSEPLPHPLGEVEVRWASVSGSTHAVVFLFLVPDNPTVSSQRSVTRSPRTCGGSKTTPITVCRKGPLWPRRCRCYRGNQGGRGPSPPKRRRPRYVAAGLFQEPGCLQGSQGVVVTMERPVC